MLQLTKRKRVLLESNSPRNSQLETHQDEERDLSPGFHADGAYHSRCSHTNRLTANPSEKRQK